MYYIVYHHEHGTKGDDRDSDYLMLLVVHWSDVISIIVALLQKTFWEREINIFSTSHSRVILCHFVR